MSKKKFMAEQIVTILREAEVLPRQVIGIPSAKAEEGCGPEEECRLLA